MGRRNPDGKLVEVSGREGGTYTERVGGRKNPDGRLVEVVRKEEAM